MDVAYDADFRAIAIFTAQKGYRLCWLLNHHLETAFTRFPDFVSATGKDHEEKSIAVYGHEEPLLYNHFYLLSNKTQGHTYLDAPPNMDFLLLIKSPGDRFDMQDILKKIRAIPQVNTAIEADTMLGKNAGSLFYDFEMYLSQKADT